MHPHLEEKPMQKRSVSSVGLERFLHTEEVESSNLPQTTPSLQNGGFFYCSKLLISIILYLIFIKLFGVLILTIFDLNFGLFTYFLCKFCANFSSDLDFYFECKTLKM